MNTDLKKDFYFSKGDVSTFEEINKLFKNLIKVDWEFLGNIYNLENMGWCVSYNKKKKAIGTCYGIRKTVELSKYYIKNNLDKPKQLEDVMRHEIAHAIDNMIRGRSAHDNIWKSICKQTTLAKPKRTNGILNSGNAHKWNLVCPNCNYTVKYFRKPKQNKACGKCCKKHNDNKFSLDYKMELVKVK